MDARRFLTLLTLATATTVFAAAPEQVCQTRIRADHACCRSHQHQPTALAAACHQEASTESSARGLLPCECAHQPAAPAEQITAPGQVQSVTHGAHTASAASGPAVGPEHPVEARQLAIREAAGPPLFTLSCALLI